MAAKRLLEQLATYDSSSDDDLSESDAVDNEEEEEEEQVVEKNGSENGVEKSGDDIDEEEEEEEDMEEDEKVKSPVKKKKPTVWRPNDSDNSPPRSPSLAGFTVEPKNKAPAEPDNKREREPDEDSSKKKKRKVAVAEDPKKASGVAVVMWSEEDEIALLKGMSHYKAKKGTDPNADMGDFHDFIKEKLNPDITKYKLSEKIRRLKKKYLNNASKIEDDDEDPIFPKPHELQSFQLSKKIWGTDKKDESMSNKKKKESTPTPIPIPIPTTPQTLTKTTATGKLSEKYPYLYKSLGFCSMDESIQGISKMPLMESSVLEGLDRKWEKLQIVEVECFLRKTELINEQGKLLLDILKNM